MTKDSKPKTKILKKILLLLITTTIKKTNSLLGGWRSLCPKERLWKINDKIVTESEYQKYLDKYHIICEGGEKKVNGNFQYEYKKVKNEFIRFEQFSNERDFKEKINDNLNNEECFHYLAGSDEDMLIITKSNSEVCQEYYDIPITVINGLDQNCIKV